MEYAGVNSQDIKHANRSKIIRLLNDRGNMSRKDIASELGLTPAAVTMICADLISYGILHETGKLNEESKLGRRKVLLGLNYNYRLALCIGVEVDETFITLCKLNGEIVSQISFETEKDKDADKFIEDICIKALELMKNMNCMETNLLGIGISIPGLVDKDKGISYLANRIWNREVDIRGAFAEYFGCPILLENNVKAFAEAEMVYSSGKEEDNIIFVKWGPGVGSSLIIHNTIYDNSKYGFSEMGHLLIRDDMTTTLEKEVSTHTIVNKVKEVFSKEHTPELFDRCCGKKENITAHNFADWGICADKMLKEILEEKIMLMVKATYNAMALIPTDLVIYYGEIFEVEYIKQKYEEKLENLMDIKKNNRIRKSELSSKLGYIGSLAILFNRLFIEENIY